MQTFCIWLHMWQNLQLSCDGSVLCQLVCACSAAALIVAAPLWILLRQLRAAPTRLSAAACLCPLPLRRHRWLVTQHPGRRWADGQTMNGRSRRICDSSWDSSEYCTSSSHQTLSRTALQYTAPHLQMASSLDEIVQRLEVVTAKLTALEVCMQVQRLIACV